MNRNKLIHKVLSGDATQEERQTLDQWKSLSEQNRQEYEDIKLLWNAGDADEEFDPELEKGFLKLQQRMRRWKRKQRLIRSATYATIILVLLFLIWWLSYHHGVSDKPSVYVRYRAGMVTGEQFQNLHI